MIASIPSAVLQGVDGYPVVVEVHVANGLPGFTVVGLPDAAVRESRDRVRASFASSGLPWPRRRITVNLAPSAIPKGGAGLDLPIAIGVLVASGVVAPEAVAGYAFVGELGLDGSLRGVPGALALADAAEVPPVGGGRRGRARGLAGRRHLPHGTEPGRGRGPLHGAPTVARATPGDDRAAGDRRADQGPRAISPT